MGRVGWVDALFAMMITKVQGQIKEVAVGDDKDWLCGAWRCLVFLLPREVFLSLAFLYSRSFPGPTKCSTRLK